MSLFQRLVYDGDLFNILGELKSDLPGEQSAQFSVEISYKNVPYRFKIRKDMLLMGGKLVYRVDDETLPVSVFLSMTDGVLDGSCSIRYKGDTLVVGNWVLGKREGVLTYYCNQIPYYHGEFKNGLPSGSLGVLVSPDLQHNKTFVDGHISEQVTTQSMNCTIKTYYNDEQLIYLKKIDYTPTSTSWDIEYTSYGLPILLKRRYSARIEYLIKRFYVKDKTNYMVVTSESNTLIYRGGYSFYPPFWFLFNGEGQLYQKNRIMYRGSFKNGLRHGKGCFYYSNGVVKYNGPWENDLPEGNGTLYRDDGSVWGEIICSKGTFTAGMKRRSIFTFLPSHGLTEFFNSREDPDPFDSAVSWTLDPQFFRIKSLGPIMQEGETSPILRYNMERRQLIEDYKRWLKLDENAVLSRMESLSIDCNMGLNISLDYSLFCNLVNLSIGNNSFASLSDLVLSEMFFLKHVTIGDNCFNGKMQGSLVFRNLPNLQTISVGMSFANAKQFTIECILLFILF